MTVERLQIPAVIQRTSAAMPGKGSGHPSRGWRGDRTGAAGLTIVEMLVAMTVALVVAASVLTLSLSGRRAYETDEGRMDLNRDMRAALEMLVADARQAGERLGDDFPALEIVDGSGGAADQLVLRRNLLDTVLRVCSDTASPDTEIDIAQPIGPPLGCAPVPDDDGDSWPENLQAWREYRLAAGTTVRAYIYNPTTRLGEFFDYVGEQAGTYRVQAAAGTSFANSYPVGEFGRLYLLEERRYELAGDMVQVVVNGDSASPLRIADGIDDFQATAVLQDWSEQPSLGPLDDWSGLRAIHIALDGGVLIRDERLERTWTADVMPRNVLSR